MLDEFVLNNSLQPVQQDNDQLGVAGLINALIVGAVYLSLFLFFKRNL